MARLAARPRAHTRGPWPNDGSAPTSASGRTSATPRRCWPRPSGSACRAPGARLRGVSRLYATVPVGVTDQPEFRNAVVALDVPAGPNPETGALRLLAHLKEIERAFGRRRRRRWGPRELDLDLLVFGRARLAVERPPEARSIDADTDAAKASKLLEVPHPAAATRLFVLAPLADLAPRLVPPGWGMTVETARRRQARMEGETAVRVVAEWDPTSGRWRRPVRWPDSGRNPPRSDGTQPR